MRFPTRLRYFFISSKPSSPAVGPLVPKVLSRGVKRPGRECDLPLNMAANFNKHFVFKYITVLNIVRGPG